MLFCLANEAALIYLVADVIDDWWFITFFLQGIVGFGIGLAAMVRIVALIVVASILSSLSFSFPPLQHLYPAHFLMAFLMLYCLPQGNRAVAEIQFADYIYPAFDQACFLSSCFRELNVQSWLEKNNKCMQCWSSLDAHSTDCKWSSQVQIS